MIAMTTSITIPTANPDCIKAAGIPVIDSSTSNNGRPQSYSFVCTHSLYITHTGLTNDTSSYNGVDEVEAGSSNGACVLPSIDSYQFIITLFLECVCVCVCVWGGGGGGDDTIMVTRQLNLQ